VCSAAEQYNATVQGLQQKQQAAQQQHQQGGSSARKQHKQQQPFPDCELSTVLHALHNPDSTVAST
jgi:hypothetical protein